MSCAGDADSDTYRTRAAEWRAKAEALPPSDERDACMMIAGGYEHLAALIENDIRFKGGAIGRRGAQRRGRATPDDPVILSDIVFLEPGGKPGKP